MRVWCFFSSLPDFILLTRLCFNTQCNYTKPEEIIFFYQTTICHANSRYYFTPKQDDGSNWHSHGKEAPCGFGRAVEVKHLSGSQTHQAASYLEKHSSNCQSHNSSEQHGISVHLKCNVANPQIKISTIQDKNTRTSVKTCLVIDHHKLALLTFWLEVQTPRGKTRISTMWIYLSTNWHTWFLKLWSILYMLAFDLPSLYSKFFFCCLFFSVFFTVTHVGW